MSKCRRVFWKSAITVITKDKTQILIWKSFMCSVRRIFFTLMCQTHFFPGSLAPAAGEFGRCMYESVKRFVARLDQMQASGGAAAVPIAYAFSTDSLNPDSMFLFVCVHVLCVLHMNAHECVDLSEF